MGFKKSGFVLVVISLFVFLFNANFSITGNVIGDYFNNVSFFNVLPLVLFLTGFVLLFAESNKGLEAIVVPTGPTKRDNISRAKRGGESYNPEDSETAYYVISGEKGDNLLKDSGRANIYKELREYGIKPSEIKIEGKSKDSIENVMHTLKKLEPDTKKIHFVSYPLHLKRLNYILEKAKEEGYAPKDLEVENFSTKQNWKESIGNAIYGVPALLKEKWRLRKGIDYALNHKSGKFIDSLKKFYNKIERKNK